MPKLPAILALTVATTLLTGCSAASNDEPDAGATSASEAPSATPSPEQAVTEEPEETAEPSAEPSTEPSAAPTEPQEEPTPTPEPSPAPAEPFVPPPHGEPAPGTPFVPPPHGEPNPFAGEQIHTVTPGPEWGTVQTVVEAGSALTVLGSGYQPGQRVAVFFGPSQSDYSIIGEQSAYTDLNGNYSFTITLSPAIAPGTYGVVTATPDGLPSGVDVDSTRRWATIEVVAP